MNKQLVLVALCLCGWLISLSFAQTVKRDHLTEKEVDLVREWQEIDKRIEIFVKAADRRLLLLQNPEATQTKKEEDNWGPLPKGTALELLSDYKRLLEEAMDKLEDAYERNGKDPKIPKALNKFKEAATRHLSPLRALADKLTAKTEQRALAEAIEEAETVTKGSMQN